MKTSTNAITERHVSTRTKKKALKTRTRKRTENKKVKRTRRRNAKKGNVLRNYDKARAQIRAGCRELYCDICLMKKSIKLKKDFDYLTNVARCKHIAKGKPRRAKRACTVTKDVSSCVNPDAGCRDSLMPVDGSDGSVVFVCEQTAGFRRPVGTSQSQISVVTITSDKSDVTALDNLPPLTDQQFSYMETKEYLKDVEEILKLVEDQRLDDEPRPINEFTEDFFGII